MSAPKPAAAEPRVPAMSVVSWEPRGLTPDEEWDRRLNEACKNAAQALVKRAQTREMLSRWLETASSHMVDLGFQLGAGAPSFTGEKTRFTRELRVARTVRDSVSGRPMALRIEFSVASEREFFGRLEASIKLISLGGKGTLGHANTHCLQQMQLFRTDPEPGLVQFGGLTERLERHLATTVQNCFPGGIDKALLEFCARVDDALAP